MMMMMMMIIIIIIRTKILAMAQCRQFTHSNEPQKYGIHGPLRNRI